MHEHYVYVHKRPDGHVFYVGKGQGRRAYSTDRGALWEHYVKTRCAGTHDVEIVAYFSTEEEALAHEDALIRKFGSQLLNCISNGRHLDYKAIERFNLLRNANKLFAANVRNSEHLNPTNAIESYRIALANIDQYSSIVTEQGIIPELQKELLFPEHSDVEVYVLDRVSLLLFRAGRFSELIAEVDRYTRKYPNSLTTTLGQGILKRRARAAKCIPLATAEPCDAASGSFLLASQSRVGWWGKQRSRLSEAWSNARKR